MFEIGTVLSKGWEDFKKHAVTFIVALILMGVISMVVSFASQMLVGLLAQAGDLVAILGLVVAQIISQAVNCFFMLGLMGMNLKAIRGDKPEIGDLFGGGKYFVPGVIAYFIVTIATMIGFVLLIVPGIIVAIATCLALYFVIDKELDPISAIKASVGATQGSWLNLFLFFVVAFLLMIVGAIPCGLGLLVVAPLIGLSLAHVYETLSGKAELEA